MALGTIGTALATTGLKLGAGFLADKLSDKSGGLSSYAPTGFSGGGLTGRSNANGFNVAASRGRQGVLGNLTSLFPQQANMVAGLRDLVSPGMGALTTSRLGELDNRRRQAIGDLRDNLARRRVLGSSFASDAVNRGELAFAQEADKVRAESFLQELDLTNQFIQQEFGLRRQEFQAQLDDMNFQAELAAQMGQAASSQMAANARLKEQLNAQSAAGMGRFFGSAIQPLNSIFSGGGNAPIWSTVAQDASGAIV